MEIIKSCGNVFLDLGFPPAEAETLRIRAELMMTLQDYLKSQRLTVTMATTQLGITKTTVTKLLDGDINRFTVETLIAMLVNVGLPVEVKIKKTPLKPRNVVPKRVVSAPKARQS
jgi:predicted XRE-type DNA-binding protein